MQNRGLKHHSFIHPSIHIYSHYLSVLSHIYPTLEKKKTKYSKYPPTHLQQKKTGAAVDCFAPGEGQCSSMECFGFPATLDKYLRLDKYSRGSYVCLPPKQCASKSIIWPAPPPHFIL